jgi:hypothetical protein
MLAGQLTQPLCATLCIVAASRNAHQFSPGCKWSAGDDSGSKRTITLLPTCCITDLLGVGNLNCENIAERSTVPTVPMVCRICCAAFWNRGLETLTEVQASRSFTPWTVSCVLIDVEGGLVNDNNAER